MDYMLTYTSGSVSTLGDNTLIAAPGAGQRIAITLFIIENNTGVATSLQLKDGSTTQWTFVNNAIGDCFSCIFPHKQEWRLSANSALVLNLGAANQHFYNVNYFVEHT